MSTPPIVKVTAPTVATAPVSQATLQQQVNARQGATVSIPKGLVSKSTNDIVSPWLRCCLYGELDSWKTVTAAEFGSPDDVRIIFTRGEDQLRGLTGKDYKYVVCEDTRGADGKLESSAVQKFRHAIMYPESLWPEWANRPNRVIVIDDLTKGKDLLLEDNETDENGRERRDMRMVHREAKTDMGDLMRSLMSKPLHVIMVAMAQIYKNDVSQEETVTPDIPPAMSRLLMADASFIFFLDRAKRMMLTTSKRETYRKKDDKGVEQTFTRSILARHKLPKHLEPNPAAQKSGLLAEYEPISLAAIWTKIQSAKGAL